MKKVIINFRNNNNDEIPDDLFEILISYPAEYGTANLNNQNKHPSMELYEIEDEETKKIVGYFWIDKKPGNKYFFSVTIKEEYRRKNLAKESLEKAKSILKDKGINIIYAQVNKNIDYGLILRSWLLKENFAIEEKKEFLKNLSDSDYIKKYNSPIIFYLNL